MATLRYRNRRRSTNLGGGSVTYTPNPAVAAPEAPKDPLLEAAKRWNAEVQLANDRKALDELASGHSDWFLGYAKKRASESSGEDQTYWQSLVDETDRHIVEDNLQQGVAAGRVDLEDVKDYITKRMDTLGAKSGEYASLLKSLGDVKNAIAARDFNAEINEAQKGLVETGDHAAYLATLKKIATRSRDASATAALSEQIGDLEKRIDDEKVITRYNDANSKVIDYLDGKVSRAELVPFLKQMAATAGSTEEANHYVTLASQVDTRERTLENQRVSEAAGGTSRAFTEQLDILMNSYDTADASVVEAFRHSRADREVFSDFQKEAKHTLDVLRRALPEASTRAISERINNAITSVTKNVAEREKQMSIAIADDVIGQAGDYLDAAKRATAVNKSSLDAIDVASQQRYLATQLLNQAVGDPLLRAEEQQLGRVQKMLRDVSGDHQTDIERETGILSGAIDNSYEAAVRSSFKTYEDYMVTHAKDKTLVTGPAKTYDEYVGAFGNHDAESFAAALNLKPKNDSLTQAAKWQNDLRQAYRSQEEAITAANARLQVLVAPRRVDDGRSVKEGPAPLDSLVDVTDFLRTNGVPPFLYAHREQDIPPQEVNTYAAAGLLDPTGASKGGGLASFDTSSQYVPNDEDDPYTAAEKRAFHFLSRPTVFHDMPNWSIPDLPETPAFVPQTPPSLAHLFDMPDAPLYGKKGTGGAVAPTEGISGPQIAA